jgi:hypothetical protein
VGFATGTVAYSSNSILNLLSRGGFPYPVSEALFCREIAGYFFCSLMPLKKISPGAAHSARKASKREPGTTDGEGGEKGWVNIVNLTII